LESRSISEIALQAKGKHLLKNIKTLYVCRGSRFFNLLFLELKKPRRTMKKTTAPASAHQRRAYTALLLTTALTACAQPLGVPKMKYANHAFAFDAIADSPNEEVLAYRYGAGKGVGMSSDTGIRQFGTSPQVTGVNGGIPIGDTLYVKWRSRATKQAFEDTVDLRPLLPKDMESKEVYFVVRGAQLSVYLTDLKQRRPDSSPIVGPFRTQMYLTRQIYPRP
jgi:hypothetical protein